MATRKPKPDAERVAEIVVRLLEQNHAIARIDRKTIILKAEVKTITKEREGRAQAIHALLFEMEIPGHVCTKCGVVRQILETVWDDLAVCPDCEVKTKEK